MKRALTIFWSGDQFLSKTLWHEIQTFFLAQKAYIYSDILFRKFWYGVPPPTTNRHIFWHFASWFFKCSLKKLLFLDIVWVKMQKLYKFELNANHSNLHCKECPYQWLHFVNCLSGKYFGSAIGWVKIWQFAFLSGNCGFIRFLLDWT